MAKIESSSMGQPPPQDELRVHDPLRLIFAPKITPVAAATTTGTNPNVGGLGGVIEPEDAPVENGPGLATGT
jgi:hypothetical protein